MEPMKINCSSHLSLTTINGDDTCGLQEKSTELHMYLTQILEKLKENQQKLKELHASVLLCAIELSQQTRVCASHPRA